MSGGKKRKKKKSTSFALPSFSFWVVFSPLRFMGKRGAETSLNYPSKQRMIFVLPPRKKGKECQQHLLVTHNKKTVDFFSSFSSGKEMCVLSQSELSKYLGLC